MSYVIYHVETTKVLRSPAGGVGCYKEAYATERAAKAALTRAVTKGKITEKEANEDYRIDETGHFREYIEKKEKRSGAGPAFGETFEVAVNTPWSSGPWSDAYWSS